MVFVWHKEGSSWFYFSNPKVEPAATLFVPNKDHNLYPIYPESRGVTSNWIYHAIKKVLSKNILEDLVDPIPKEILDKYSLPTLKTALVWIHTPKIDDHEFAVRKRF